MISVSKLYDHAIVVYRELQHRAQNGVFEGGKLEAYRATGISQGYYSSIFDYLTELGAIEQTRKGTAAVSSVIVLHGEPTLEQFQNVYRPLTNRESDDTLQQQVNDMKRRMPQIDVDSFILSFDQRLTDLEARMSQIEGQTREE